MAIRYFEDFKVGDVVESAGRTLTKEEILAFAREFDPQPFHTDEAAARETMYGGLIASGWHSGSLMMRLFYDSLFREVASLGSPGIDELRWLSPSAPATRLAFARRCWSSSRRARSRIAASCGCTASCAIRTARS